MPTEAAARAAQASLFLIMVRYPHGLTLPEDLHVCTGYRNGGAVSELDDEHARLGASADQRRLVRERNYVPQLAKIGDTDTSHLGTNLEPLLVVFPRTRRTRGAADYLGPQRRTLEARMVTPGPPSPAPLAGPLTYDQ